jgi:general secretion pathway protein G
MKVRCPYCQAIFEPQARNRCSACGKTVLLPGFFGTAGKLPAGTLARPARRRRGRGATPGVGVSVLGKPVLVFAVIVIMGGVAALLVQRSRSGPPPSEAHNRRVAYENLRTLRVAVDQFKQDCGDYPSSTEGLAALLLNPNRAGWHGPYIFELKPDPWGVSFRYHRDPGRTVLHSVGPDGQEDSPDDIRLEWTDQMPLEVESGVYPVRLTNDD